MRRASHSTANLYIDGMLHRGRIELTVRAGDWFAQADRDLAHAEDSLEQGSHEWACFASHQSAEKAVKALHLHLGQESWGHVVAKLLRELPIEVPAELVERGQVLDNFYVAGALSQRTPRGSSVRALRSPPERGGD